MKKTAFIALCISLFIVISTSVAALNIDFTTDEALTFGGYCYYVESGDIYRSALTEMAGSTELFRKNSSGISLVGEKLISLGKNGEVNIYSLTEENGNEYINNYNSSSKYEEEMLLGSLSAKYESNGNPAAISSGNGDAGGVSFGAYQFASKAGVPKTFADWCISTEKAPDIGSRLLTAFDADSNLYGESFKNEWKAIAAEDPTFFLYIQHDFVKEKYYDAIVSRIEKNVENFDMDMYGIALKNVFWSRATQHGVGGSYNVITRAFESIGGFNLQSEEILIRAIYAESGAVSDSGTNPMTGTRAEEYGISGKYMKYYSKNSSAVQLSVYRRLNFNELSDALDMLSEYGGYVSSPENTYKIDSITANEITENSAVLNAMLFNYKLSSVTEYGFFIGKDISNLVEIPVSRENVSKPVISFSASTLSFCGELDAETVYYFGVYALICGEYVSSEIYTFKTKDRQTFSVKYFSDGGELLYECKVKEGMASQYIGDTPKKSPNEQFRYEFSSWKGDESAIFCDTEFYPNFEKKDYKWSGKTAAGFFGGNGTEAFPYIISSGEELAFLSKFVADGNETRGLFFELCDNIVLSSGDSYTLFTPIGNEEYSFSGHFNGNGFKIIGLRIESENLAALFGRMDGGKIENLIIEKAKTSGRISGGIVAEWQNTLSSDSFIRNCSVNGEIIGSEYAGAIAGYAGGEISIFDVTSSGEVKADVCGGIVGLFKGLSLDCCFSSAIVSGKNIGSVCGVLEGTALPQYCYYPESTLLNKYGTPLAEDALKNEDSYLSYDFANTWCIENGCASLAICSMNSFTYRVYGDVDNNGELDIADLVMLIQYIAKWELVLSDNFAQNADVDGNGEIDISDTVMLAQMIAKWDVF